MKYVFLLSLLFFIPVNTLSGSNSFFNTEKHKLGIVVGYANNMFFDVNYRYRIVMIQPQFYYSLFKKDFLELEMLFQPQFNTTIFGEEKTNFSQNAGIEFGLNFGPLLRLKPKNSVVSYYASISVGPHYVSGAPSRQSSGFVFLGNAFGGINVLLGEILSLDLRAGYRHISNAGIKEPNAGVENVFLNIGFVFVP
ncbi:MAG: acyloxyacyl hydrolase [Bacteroidales bacterium]|nr:acyloxyacyl hydrolase [Bacteroidales bacterium]